MKNTKLRSNRPNNQPEAAAEKSAPKVARRQHQREQ